MVKSGRQIGIRTDTLDLREGVEVRAADRMSAFREGDLASYTSR